MDASVLSQEPSFAVICSFFNKFGVMLGLKPHPFPKLESLLTTFDDGGRVQKELIDLFVRLLRRVQIKSASHARWENGLLKFCSLVPSLEQEYYQLDRFGYAHTALTTKLKILKVLCETQFDFNPKFKESLMTSLSSAELRLLPVGVDNAGQAYWYQQDADLNLRIYSEEPDDLSGGTWMLRAKTRDDLASLIEKLRSGKSPTGDATNGSATVSDDSDSEPLQKSVIPKTEAVTEPEPEPEPKIEENGREIKEEEEPEPEKEEETNDTESPTVSNGEESKLKVKNKKGTFMDTYQPTPPKPKPKRTEQIKETEEQGEKSDDSTPDIPDELKPFIERRVQPRRSSRNAANKLIKDVTAGSGSNSVDGEQEEKRSAAGSSSSGKSESDTGRDSDYMPLSCLRKPGSGKRRRKIKEKILSSSDEEGEEQVKKERKKATLDTICMKCGQSSNPEVLLLCDQCDDACHTWCLRPALWYVPDDDWFCPKCQHTMLIDKLSSALTALDEQLKKKSLEDRKKKTAADRLKREIEFIGVSLNNIIPAENEGENSNSESDQSESEKKRKKKSKERKVLPIAVTRTRRERKAVDYNFYEFDEIIQESIDEIQEAPSRPTYQDPVRPQGGAGRGKDMANILQAEASRETAAAESAPEPGARVGKPPSALLAKKRNKLTDLDVDNMSESETDEYKESSASDDEPSDDEWFPEDELPTRRSQRLRQRTQSDEDFVVSGSGSDDSDDKRRTRKTKAKAAKQKSNKKRKRKESSSGSEDSLVEKARQWHSSDNSSSDGYRPTKKKKHKFSANSSGNRRTRGRRINYRQIGGDSDSEDSEPQASKKKEERPVGALTRPRRRVTVDSESDENVDEWKPAPENSGSESSKNNESGEESGKEKEKATDDTEKKSVVDKKRKNTIESSSDDDKNEGEKQEEEEEESGNEQEAEPKSSDEKQKSPEPQASEPASASSEPVQPSEPPPAPEATADLSEASAPATHTVIQPLPRPAVPQHVRYGVPTPAPPYMPQMSMPAYHSMQPAAPLLHPGYPTYLPPGLPGPYGPLGPAYPNLQPLRPELEPGYGTLAPVSTQSNESLSDALSSAMQNQF